jgi:20S proteasome subunit alpha 3
VEYAIAAIQNAASAVGIQTSQGIVIASEKRVTSKLLAPPKSSEKMYKLDEHIFAAVAGLTSDANILLQYARTAAQKYRYTYNEEQPVEQIVQLLSDYKHSYTQYGGLRPFGVAFLFGGWDRHYGFQLYQSDPAGNYSGWKATAIGSNSQSAQSMLKTEYDEKMSLEEAKQLAVKLLSKSMDSANPTAEKIEVATLTRTDDGKLHQVTLLASEVETLIQATKTTSAPETAA